VWKVWLDWESGGCETGALKKTDFNQQPFWGGGFLPGSIVKLADFTQFHSSSVGYHLVLEFRLYVRCRFMTVWWMANMWNFCFIIAFHNFPTLENRLTYQCPNSWPVVITMEKKLAGTWKKNYRILAGPNSWQQVCNWSNPEKTGRSCEGADFSWWSSKVARTLSPSSGLWRWKLVVSWSNLEEPTGAWWPAVGWQGFLGGADSHTKIYWKAIK
jgi:hypothetical protein